MVPEDSSDRIEQLDSVRGLAALSVVFCHHLLLIKPISETYHNEYPGLGYALLLLPPALIFWAGHAAVILFFVLSGYVLTLPMLRGRQPVYWYYLVKRICRIYLPYAAAVAGAMLLASALSARKIPELSESFGRSWTVPLTRQHIVEHAILIRGFDMMAFNGVIWSLVHEMRISIVFPLFALFIVRMRWWWCLAGAICLSLFGLYGVRLYWRLSFLQEYRLTFHYTALFVLGGILAKYRLRLTAFMKALSPNIRFGLVALGCVLYTAEGFHPAARGNGWLLHPFEYLIAIGASIFIVYAVNATWLRAKVLVWLGRVSYSLYLWHSPVMLATIHIGYAYLPLWVLFVSSIGLGILVSGVMHRIVEVPATQLAKWIGVATRSRFRKTVAAG